MPANQITLNVVRGVVNKGIVLPVALIIIVLVVAVLILALAKPTSGQYVRYSQPNESVIKRYNQLLYKYDQITEELWAAVNVRSTQASLYQDADASRILQTYVSTVNKKQMDLKDYILNAREYLSEGNAISANYNIQAAESDIYMIEDIVNEIKNMNVKDMRGFNQDKTKERSNWNSNQREWSESSASDTTVYFKGCKNKEELTLRYKSLAKTLHPDVKGGDTMAFQEMKSEYERLMKGIES